MTDQIHSEPSQETKDVPGVTGSLASLNTHLAHHLDKLKSLGPSLTEALHHDHLLPDREDLRLAARAIDLLHELRMLLEPPVLILADHFLGIYTFHHLLHHMLINCRLCQVQMSCDGGGERHRRRVGERPEDT